jgi:P-type Cu2+ transporter
MFMQKTCYHCGLVIENEKQALSAPLAQQDRLFCCAGCLSVATFIQEGGLDQYYAYRSALSEHSTLPATLSQEHWVIYDDSLVQASFVRTINANEKEAVLLLEGIRCAACIWLNEQHLMHQPGVLSAQINYSNHRLRLRWNPNVRSLSHLFRAISDIGYRAWPFDAKNSEDLMIKEQRSALFRLAVALVGMMQVMMYAWPAYFAVGSLDGDNKRLLNGVSLVLTVPVVVYSAAPMYRAAWRSIIHRHIGMDVPVVLGITAAFVASCAATILNQGAVYFDSISMFIGFLLAARYIEFRLRQQARFSAEQIVHHAPEVSQRWINYPEGQPESIASIHLVPGDIVYVKAGEVFPCDGKVIAGESEAEEALLTGESRPIPKHVGDRVFSGSYNFSSPLVIRAINIGEETRLAEIARLLDNALVQKPRMTEIADRFASWFVVALLIIAAGVAWFWWWHEPAKALMITVSVLVVSCPCALSLATPAALAAAMGSLARKSILVLGKNALETLSQVTDVVIDKTGTLTTGQFELLETRIMGCFTSEDCLGVAGALAQSSEHPLAKRLAALCPDKVSFFREIKSYPGMGIEGVSDNKIWRMGRYSFASALNVSSFLKPLDLAPHLSTVWLGNEEGIQALFLFSDALRDGAESFIQSMKKQGKRIHLLSGDRADTVAFWAHRLQIEAICSEATPADKKNYVQRLQGQGLVVAMIGDGVNDAPVLGVAQVSLTLSGSAPLAQAGADIVLMNTNLEYLNTAFSVAKRTRQIIVQNLGWAFIYNLIAIPLAATGALTPLIAGIGMSLSSLLVVLNALRLTR